MEAGSAPDRFGMSRVLDTDLQANSMPLLFSMTVLQAGQATAQHVVHITAQYSTA